MVLIPDPVIIGYSARTFPIELGTLSGHGLADDFLPGHKVIYETDKGKAIFSVSVSYVPSNPKRQQLLTILQPRSELPKDLWDSVGFEKKSKISKQGEFAF